MKLEMGVDSQGFEVTSEIDFSSRLHGTPQGS